ncbi:MAG: PD-(D/E)XK nuclease family protein [Kofleriaceae bacterium]
MVRSRGGGRSSDDSTQKLLEDEVEAENQRLAYVALTRAQVRLYLPLYGEGRCRSTPRITDPALRRTVRRAAPTAPAVRGQTDRRRRSEVAPAPGDALAGFVAPPPPATGEVTPLPRAARRLEMLSYTRLANDADAAIVTRPGDPLHVPLEIHPAEFAADDAVGEVGPRELPPGASSGLLLHDVLEHADLELARRAGDLEAWHTEPEVLDQLTSAARARGIATRFLPHAAELAYATLTAPLQLIDGTTLPAMVDATALAREVEFSYPLPDARGLVKGYIDALLAWDDELWVLDYKSDVLGEDRVTSATARVREHYGIQARLYALAATRMGGGRRFAGLLFAFVRYGIVVPVRVDDTQLATWTAWLGELSTRREVRA